MTTEEAIEALSLLRIFDAPDLNEAAKMAVSALRAQQAPAKLDRSLWEGCGLCKGVTGWTQDLDDEHHEVEFLFCPTCGRPITEKAWADLERRINDGTIDV